MSQTPQTDPTAGQLFEPRGENRPEPSERWLTRIQELGLKLGFARIGFTTAQPFDEAAPVLQRWLDAGFHGDMAYLDGPRHDPARLLTGARSMIIGVWPHKRPKLSGSPPNSTARSHDTAGNFRATGYIAAYARGDDYHVVLKSKLQQLAAEIADVTGRTFRARACVDTAPLLEREAARRAHVAFTGKSTLSIVPGVGSYVLLSELLLTLELPLDEAREQETPFTGCGSCTACLDACPTGAFTAAYTLDARRCLSYLTIENKGDIPREFRGALGSHVFGCDICQAVCPYNHSRKLPAEPPDLNSRPELESPNLIQWLQLGSAGYRRLVAGSALRRVSRPSLQRNVATALGNSRDPQAVPALLSCLREHRSPLVRAHAASALAQLSIEVADSESANALAEALELEQDPTVRTEIHRALSHTSRVPPP